MSRDFEPLKIVINLGAVDASGPDERTVFVSSNPARFIAANIVDGVAKTGHANNYGTYEIINRGQAGAGTTVVASRSTDTPTTDDIDDYVAWPLTNSTTKANLEITAGDVLTFKASEEGSATSGDLTEATLILEYADGTGGGI